MHYNEFYKNLIEKLELPESAEKEFTEVVKLADENLQLGRELDKLIMRFMFPKAHDIRRFLEKLTLLSEKYSVNENTLQFVFLLLSAETLYKRYVKQGISDEIFYDTIKDLKYKFDECVDYKGYFGTFVPHWFEGFYRLERFALGRFQYEHTDIGREIVTPSGIKIKKGTKVLFLHIPSGGAPLTDEVRMDSYKKAYEFYKNTSYVKNGKIIFVCHSWLLYKEHYNFLPRNSNILKFMNDFYIYDQYISDIKEDLWRIFSDKDKLPYNELPEDTSLKKAYKDWLLAKDETGGGVGVIVFDGENIIN
jgi:hypothetical protein